MNKNNIHFPSALMIPVTELEPHIDAQAYPRMEADSAAVASTLNEGVHDVLTVIRKDDASGWWVVDGCTRLAAALDAGMDALPCLEVQGVADPSRFALIKNGMKRRVSTGTRVLSYVKIHLDKIDAATPVESHDNDGRIIRKTPVGMEEWQVRSIAKRMKVSEKDVVSAVLLARCVKEGRMPMYNADKNRQELGEEATSDEAKALDEVFNNVLVGETPIRRWAGGLKAKIATEDKERNKTDYTKMAYLALKNMETAMENWQEIPMLGREEILTRWGELLMNLPEDLAFKTKRAFGLI